MKSLPVYAVDPARFLAGAYPLWILPDLAEAGVRSFIDLTEPDEHTVRAPRVPGYDAHLELLSAQHGADLERHSFPIEDFGVPSSALLDRILAQIDDDRARQRPVYLHCWGGYGRTGVVVGAWLVQHGRATKDTFVDVIAELRAHLSNHIGSPVTTQQIEFVRQYVG